LLLLALLVGKIGLASTSIWAYIKVTFRLMGRDDQVRLIKTSSTFIRLPQQLVIYQSRCGVGESASELVKGLWVPLTMSSVAGGSFVRSSIKFPKHVKDANSSFGCISPLPLAIHSLGAPE
jgi:hypothetical protein